MVHQDWLLHVLYSRHEFEECLLLIEENLKMHQGLCEYPLYIKGAFVIQESLLLFQAVTTLNPTSVENVKQVGRSLYLLGKHKAAIEVYLEAQKVAVDDWEIEHSIGLCYAQLGSNNEAIEHFENANNIQRHDATFIQLGKVHKGMDNLDAALDVYMEALEFSPESAELLTAIGLLFLQMGDRFKAFEYLGNALTHDPRNAKTILAAGSIIQDHNDMDVALVKYRVAAVRSPNAAQLWNNIGMCFFGKQRYVAAIATLKRALFLDPFEWITSYNLGLVHLNTEQYASAFHYFSTSINLKSDFPSTYMYMAIALSRLDDFDNACNAYEKALEMEDDYAVHLNYAITLCLNDEVEKAKEHFMQFENKFSVLDDEAKQSDAEILEQRKYLRSELRMN